MLIDEIQNHESILSTLSEKIIALELILNKLNEDISKADLEKEERSANISQLVVMEKSFKEKTSVKISREETMLLLVEVESRIDSKERLTELRPARLYISTGSNLYKACHTLRKSLRLIDINSISLRIPSAFRLLNGLIWASLDAPNT